MKPVIKGSGWLQSEPPGVWRKVQCGVGGGMTASLESVCRLHGGDCKSIICSGKCRKNVPNVRDFDPLR